MYLNAKRVWEKAADRAGQMWKRANDPGVPGDFHPALTNQLLIFALSWIIATIVYGGLVTWAYHKVFVAYRDANVFADVLHSDPSTPWEPTAQSGEVKAVTRWVDVRTKADREEFLLRILRASGRLKADETIKKSEIPEWTQRKLLSLCDADAEYSRLFASHGTTLEFVIVITSEMDYAKKNTLVTPESEDLKQTVEALSAILAQQPGAIEQYERIVDDTDPALADLKNHFQKLFGAKFSTIWFWPWEMRAYFPASTASDSAVLGLIYRKYDVSEGRSIIEDQKANGSESGSATPTDASLKNASSFSEDDYNYLTSLSSEMVSRLNANASVKAAKWWLALILGPEQYVMFFLFFWMVLLMCGRAIYRWQEQAAKRELLTMIGKRFRQGVPQSASLRQPHVKFACVELARQSGNGATRRLALNIEYENEVQSIQAIGTASEKLNPLKQPEKGRKLEVSILVNSAADALQKLALANDERDAVTSYLERLQSSQTQGTIADEIANETLLSIYQKVRKQREILVGLKRALAALEQKPIGATQSKNIRDLSESISAIEQLQFSSDILSRRQGELLAQAEPASLSKELIHTVRRELENRQDNATTEGIKDRCAQSRDAASRSRALIRWIAKALPAVGFVGTVRGMLLALGNADSIVRATSAASQAAAITEVAGQLGIAFTTTFVALLMGLVTSLVSDLQSAKEFGLIDELERGLTPIVDPSQAVLDVEDVS